MNKEVLKRREAALTRLEYQHIDDSGKGLDKATVEYLSEEVRDVLLSFPVNCDEQFLETAEMLLNIQVLYQRLLTPEEAGQILYSCFNSETNAELSNLDKEEILKYGIEEMPIQSSISFCKRVFEKFANTNKED